ncbi:hypothetical protein STENM223S_11184 [Streptomyces tendae]
MLHYCYVRSDSATLSHDHHARRRVAAESLRIRRHRRRHPRRHQPAPSHGPVRRLGRRRPARRGAAGGRRLGGGGPAQARTAGGRRRGAGVGRAGQPARARAAHPRPVRAPRRRGRLPPELAPPDAHRRRRGAGRRALGGRPPRRARRPHRRGTRLGPHRRRTRLPHVHDVRGGPRPAPGARAREDLRAAADQPRVRARAARAGREARAAGRHGDDREAGRLRRPHEHHRRDADRRAGGLHPARPQVVHLGADVRRLPGAGRGAGRTVCVPSAAGAADGIRNTFRIQRLKDEKTGQPVPTPPPSPSSTGRWPGWSGPRGRA